MGRRSTVTVIQPPLKIAPSFEGIAPSDGNSITHPFPPDRFGLEEPHRAHLDSITALKLKVTAAIARFQDPVHINTDK